MSTTNLDTCADFQLYLTAIGQGSSKWQAAMGTAYPINGTLKGLFDVALIQWFADLCDASTALVAVTTVTAALAVALTTAMIGVRQVATWSTWNPDTSTAYKLYVTASTQASAADGTAYTEVTPMNGALKAVFDRALIEWFCVQAAAGVTLSSSTSMATAIAAALASVANNDGGTNTF